MSAHAVTAEDFRRSDRFLLGSARDTLNGEIQFAWCDGGRALAYRRQDLETSAYGRIDLATGETSPLFDHAKVATLLSTLLTRTVDASRLPIDRLLEASGDLVVVGLPDGRIVRLDLAGAGATVEPEPTERTSASPDGRYLAFARGKDLWLRDLATGTERPVTSDGAPNHAYAAVPESSTEPISTRHRAHAAPLEVLWSPDGRRLLFDRLDERHVAQLHLVQAVPDDGGPRPALHSYRCDFPGERGAEVEHFVHDVASGATTRIAWPPMAATLATPIARDRA